MSNECRLYGTFALRQGVTEEQAVAALEPLRDEDLDFSVSIECGWLEFNVGYFSNNDGALAEVLENLNGLVEGGDWVSDLDCDTGCPEEALETLYIGATQNLRDKARLTHAIAELRVKIDDLVPSGKLDDVTIELYDAFFEKIGGRV